MKGIAATQEILRSAGAVEGLGEFILNETLLFRGLASEGTTHAGFEIQFGCEASIEARY
jgi:hypothetical protein